MELKGKILNFLGDSITEGSGVADITNNRYDNVIASKCEVAQVNNYGIGGTRIAYQKKPSAEARFDLYFCGRAQRMDKNADVVIVFGGTNDFGHGDADFGTLKDKTPETFCGAVDFLMNTLKVHHPQAQIVFMTPARRFNDEVVPVRAEKTPDSKVLLEYVDAIIAKGNEYGIPVLDLYRTLPINPNDEEQRAKYTTDGLHLNDNGHAVLAQHLIKFIETL